MLQNIASLVFLTADNLLSENSIATLGAVVNRFFHRKEHKMAVLFKNVEKELRAQGMSKLQLACRMNISSSDLYSALNGTKPMYPKYRKLIAEVLGKSEAELFGGEQ